MDEPEVIKIDHSQGHVTTHEESLAVHAKILLFAYTMVFWEQPPLLL